MLQPGDKSSLQQGCANIRSSCVESWGGGQEQQDTPRNIRNQLLTPAFIFCWVLPCSIPGPALLEVQKMSPALLSDSVSLLPSWVRGKPEHLIRVFKVGFVQLFKLVCGAQSFGKALFAPGNISVLTRSELSVLVLLEIESERSRMGFVAPAGFLDALGDLIGRDSVQNDGKSRITLF